MSVKPAIGVTPRSPIMHRALEQFLGWCADRVPLFATEVFASRAQSALLASHGRPLFNCEQCSAIRDRGVVRRKQWHTIFKNALAVKFSLSWLAFFLTWIAWTSAADADAIERMRPDKLRAVHEAIESLKSQRRVVSFSSGYDDVRSLLHVHSAFSHDSRGTIEEILAGAKEAGVRVILFSEHPSNNCNYFLDGHRGLQQGVLLIPGAETGGFLAYPRQNIQDQKTDTPQAFADLVRSTGGLAFVSHLEERMDWDIANVTGTEIYNTHADFKKEDRFIAALRSPLTMISVANSVRQYPQEVFGALLDYPADYLKRYDQLCQKARHTGVSANDAHHNQAYRAKVLDDGQVQLEDALGTTIAKLDPEKLVPLQLLLSGKKPGDIIFELDLDPYVRSFRHVSTHLLLTEVNEAQVWQALAPAGRMWHSIGSPIRPDSFIGPSGPPTTGRSAAKCRLPRACVCVPKHRSMATSNSCATAKWSSSRTARHSTFRWTSRASTASRSGSRWPMKIAPGSSRTRSTCAGRNKCDRVAGIAPYFGTARGNRSGDFCGIAVGHAKGRLAAEYKPGKAKRLAKMVRKGRVSVDCFPKPARL